MYKIFRKYSFILFIHTTCYLILATAFPAEAKSLSLAINPPIITIKAIPPTNVTSPLSIQNRDDTQVALQIQLKPFRAKGENGQLEYFKESPEILKNIQILDSDVPVENITLGPKQQKNLNLRINIPQDTTISDYYFSVIFVSADSSQTESNSSVNQVGIATNVLLSVGSKEISQAVLEEFSSNIFFEEGPVPFIIRVKNTGIHFIKPKGKISIKNMFGQTIGNLDLTNVNILADSTRAIPNDIYMQELRLKASLNTKGKNDLDFKYPVALWKENFLLGLYTATLNISISDEGPVFTKTLYFLAFPLQILIIIVIIIIATTVISNRLRLYTNKDRT